MNKLIITLAATGFSLMAHGTAQVYEFTLSLKSTEGAIGTASMPCGDCNTGTSYRKGKTVKIKGLFWGCNCNSIVESKRYTAPTEDGCIFWNETAKQVIAADFMWNLLGRIDKRSNKLECTWTLSTTNGLVSIHGGGIGTIKDTVGAECDLSATYIKSVTGSCGGWLPAPSVIVEKGTPGQCSYCSSTDGTPDIVSTVLSLSLCGVCASCGNDCYALGVDKTTAYGNWKVKLHSKATKKLLENNSILRAYSFPSYVSDYMETHIVR